MAEVEAGAIAPAPVAPAPATAPAEPASAGTAPPSTEGETPTKPPRTFTQEEMSAIAAKEAAKAERRMLRELAQAKAERDLLRRQMEEAKPKSEQPKGRPQIKDFENDPDGYMDALTEWKLEQREAAKAKEREGTQVADTQAQRVREMMDAVSKGSEELEDFQDIAFNPELPVTERMAQAIYEAEAPAKVLYHLGKNVAEARRIASLSAKEQGREIAKLEAKLLAPPKTTSAPPPIKPSEGSGSTDTGYRPDMTDKEFATWRNRQKAQKRR